MDRRVYSVWIPAVGDVGCLSIGESLHLRKVLRARAGDQVGVLDGAGTLAQVEILPGSGREPVQYRVRQRDGCEPPAVKFVLYVAPPRSKQMGLLVRQAVELGVWEIRPFISERSVSVPKQESADGWAEDARDACKQSGNRFLPRIFPPAKLQDALNAGIVGGYVALPPTAGEPGSFQRGAEEEEAWVSLWIGPEGGFSADETRSLLDTGLRPLVIGRWTLRVETAVTACLSCLKMGYGS